MYDTVIIVTTIYNTRIYDMAKVALFPLGVAVGKAHVNRNDERRRLADNVLNVRHTWLAARRRMGKTSLIEQVRADVKTKRKIASAGVDLLVAHDLRAVEARIRGAVESAAVELLPSRQRRTERLQRAFSRLRPEFSVGGKTLRMTLHTPQDPQRGIEQALMALDDAAAEHNRRVMFVFDEFQQLRAIKADGSLEGSIRHAVERASNVAYVFAGSERHLLADMFEDPDRPLYHLCERMSVQRISAQAYTEFLNHAAKARWRRPLADKVVDTLLASTLRHPYYVNALCGRLWQAEQAPNPAVVQRAWKRFVEEDQRRAASRVLALSSAQRGMLAGIARAGEIQHPTGQVFLQQLRMATSTGLAAKEVLERQDLIQQTETGAWCLVDPVMAAGLANL